MYRTRPDQNKVNTRNRKQKSHSHGRHPPHPHPPPPNPRTELKDKCKSKPACAENRKSAKILQKTMRNATHTGKHRKKRCDMQSSTCFCTVQPAGWRTFFAIKHRKNRCESKSKVQLRVNKVPKLSTCQQRNRTTPRGGRRNGCQKQPRNCRKARRMKTLTEKRQTNNK